MINNKIKEEILWKKYKENKCQSAKEELVLSYVPLVKHIAGRIITKIPDKLTFDDLVNYGILGLMDAIDKFDIDRNIKFSTYAVPRIRGAIYDEIRSLDWVPQSVRRKSKMLIQAYADLKQRFKRSPTDKEVRTHLGLSKEKFKKLLHQVNIPENISLDTVITQQSNNKLKLKDLIKGTEDKEPDSIFEYNQVKQILGHAIDKLPDKEKLIISLYYYEDLTLTEIGEIMELTTARISQLHTKAIFRLRGHLGQKKNALVG